MNVAVGINQSLPGNVAVSGSAASNLEHMERPTLYLPLPFFFSRDSGLALPTASLPYNEMRVNFKFRDWNQLTIWITSTKHLELLFPLVIYILKRYLILLL